MELVALVLAVAVVLLTAIAFVAVSRVPRRGGAQMANGRRTRRTSADLTLVEAGGEVELRVQGAQLMRLEPVSFSEDQSTTFLTGPFVEFIGSLLGDTRVLEFLAGQRWVLAKVPDAMRHGGEWMRSGDTFKAVVRNTRSGRYAGIADLVRGGTAAGATAALGPAVVGAVAVAYAHHTLEASVKRVDLRLRSMEHYRRNTEIGAVLGARSLVEHIGEWGHPHLWPEQLKTELAVRTVGLDPICFAMRSDVGRRVSELLRNDTTFRGLKFPERQELLASFEHLLLAEMTRAQLCYATTLVLLDSEDAPYGLERLDRVTSDFVRGLEELTHELGTALEGKRPRLRVLELQNAKKTEPFIEGIVDDLGGLIRSLAPSADAQLLLGVDASGAVQIALPPALPDEETSEQ